jgi:hypothetical protein
VRFEVIQAVNPRIHFRIVACREQGPDLWDLMDDHADALAELRKVAD